PHQDTSDCTLTLLYFFTLILLLFSQILGCPRHGVCAWVLGFSWVSLSWFVIPTGGPRRLRAGVEGSRHHIKVLSGLCVILFPQKKRRDRSRATHQSLSPISYS